MAEQISVNSARDTAESYRVVSSGLDDTTKHTKPNRVQAPNDFAGVRRLRQSTYVPSKILWEFEKCA